jgi:serine protease Do
MQNLARILLTVLLFSFSCAAYAGSMALGESERWLQIASSKDRNTAVGIAMNYDYGTVPPQVIAAGNGNLAVVLGPFKEKTMAAFKVAHPDFPEFPKDAILTRGKTFTDSVWVPETSPVKLQTYSLEMPLTLSDGALTFTVALGASVNDITPTVLRGVTGGTEVFKYTVADYEPFDPSFAEAGLAKLDPDADGQQLILSRYSGGAHCCTQVWFVTKPQGAAEWALIDGGQSNGGAYSYANLDGDQSPELLNPDNLFYYTFDCYACSFAPLQIFQVKGNVIKPAAMSGAVRDRYLQELAGWEFSAHQDPSLWNTNGFLAGWVAAKMRLGEGDKAWAKMLKHYQKDNGFGPSICKSGQGLGDCPADQISYIPFPKALADFLKDRDYGPLPKAAQ